jgi:hypothetical protein
MKIAFIDTETTGLSCCEHEIIEIAAIIYDQKNDNVIKEWECKVAPRHIESANSEALQINKYINNPSLYVANINSALIKFNSVVANCILVGQNIDFDLMFIKKFMDEFPLKKGDEMDGAAIIYEKPKTNEDGTITSGRYIGGWDVVETDGNDNFERSLQSFLIMDLWTDKIVFEYTSRTQLVEQFYEVVRLAALYYNAKINYENNIKGPYAYFKNKNSLYLLSETPKILKDQNMIKSIGFSNTSLGTPMNGHIKSWGLQLILTWLSTASLNLEYGTKNLNTIYSPALLKELISYNADINVDRVSALLLLMIAREDRQKVIQAQKQETVKSKTSSDYWNRAYNKRYNKTKLSFSFDNIR